MTTKQQVVVLEYQDLVDGKDLSSEVGTAFGFEGIGLLAVRGVPKFPQLREALLPLSREFALLPNDTKAKYEHPESFFSFGWSHGKEKFHGKPDVAKGSYYANPQYNRPVEDDELVAKHMPFIHPNIWPTDHLAALEPAFMACGQLMVEIGLLVAQQCDKLVSAQCESYENGKLERLIKSSRCCKARLLHYFEHKSDPSETDIKPDSWCGWHNDHGSLTALCPGMFLNDKGEPVDCPDPTAGLYVHTRQGQTIKASVPKDCIVFQIGETAQVHSGGLLQATPHCVMAGNTPGLTRESFAVFMEPEWDEAMSVPEGRKAEDAMMGSKQDMLPAGVPMLEKRWGPEMDMAEFTEKTLKCYYD